MSDDFAPPPLAVPTMRPDEVKGYVAHAERTPDRYFYFLDASHPAGERVWEADGWFIEDKGTNKRIWTIVLTCPLCEKALKLDSDRKKFVVYDPVGIETDEPFQCSYPAEFGDGAPCSWRVELQNAGGKPVRLTDGREVKLDAIIRRV
jgi:hypothetical protein